MALTKMIDGEAVAMTPDEEAGFLSTQGMIVSERRRIAKSVITQRLIDAGKIEAAYAALKADGSAFARWFAPDRPDIYADNEEALALLAAIGADPDVILA